MTGKRLARTLTACLVVILGGTTILAVDSPETLRQIEQKRRFDRRGVTQRWDDYRRNYRDYRNIPLLEARGSVTALVPSPAAVDDLRTGASQLAVLDADTLWSPGLAIGVTSYDAQAHYAIGREVASNPGSETVHFCWTMWDRIPESIHDDDRFVNYNSWDKLSSSLNQGFNGTSVTIGDFARGGYCRLDVDGSNLASAALHQRLEAGYLNSAWYLLFPIEGSGLHLDTELPKSGPYPDEIEMLYPDIAVDQNGGMKDNSTDVWHVIATGAEQVDSEYGELSNRLWYWRYDNDVAIPVWEGPALIDSTRILGYTIDADDNSRAVCLAYHSDYITDGMNGLNNVVYRESYISGMGWLSETELGEINKNFITYYADPDGPQAWTETSVAYDHAGDLHILFTEQRVANESEHIALKHWSKSRGSARTVQIAYYDNPGTWARTLSLGHISLGVGDGATDCRGGIETNEDYLYAIYTKLGGETAGEQADMSQLGFANGEICFTASNSNGWTWAPPVNLTNTKLPECTSTDPDRVCPSEAWGSLARDVRDIEIFYITDYEPGAFDEAPWTMNRAMYLHFPGGMMDADFVCPVIGPSFAAYITADPECEYHADQGGANFETLTIMNLGNDQLDGVSSLTAGALWLTFPLGGFSIPAGGDDLIWDVAMNATLLFIEDLYIGEIQITHNDTSKISPYVIPIEFFVVNDFKCPQDEVLKTAVASPGVVSLEVASNARFASQNDEGGFWRFVDSSSTLFDASLLVAYGDQYLAPDTVVFHRFYEREDPGQHGWRALSDLVIDTSDYGMGDGYARAQAYMTTADSAIGVQLDWYFPQGAPYGDFVIAKYTVWNRTASPIDDVVIALWGDLDVTAAAHMDRLQRGVDNHGNYVQAQNLIYQYGYDTIWHIPGDQLESTQRYSGGVTYIAGRDASGVPFQLDQAPICGAVGDNRDNTGPGRPNSRFFYRTIVGGPGVSVWEPAADSDSAKDCYTWMQLDHGRTLDANGANPEEYVVAWVSDTLQHEAYGMGPKLAGGLPEVVDSAWAWAARNVLSDPGCSPDTTPPEVTCPGDIYVGETGSGGATVFFEASASDNCGGGCVDVVWVIDASGSMGGDQTAIANNTATFFDGLGSVDFQLGVLAFTSVANPISTGGVYLPGGAGTGQFTTSAPTFATMVTSVGDGGAITENGLSALNDALDWYPFRESCRKVLVLVTDEDADDFWNFGALVPPLLASGATIHTVINFGDSTGYSTLAPATDGGQFDITSAWGENIAALASDILIEAVCDPPSGSFFPIGVTDVMCTATDAVGLADTCEFAITVTSGCASFTTSPYLLTCPKGDILFEVYPRDGFGDPIVGYGDVYLDFSNCDPSELTPLPGAYPDWPIVHPQGGSDYTGTLRFAIAAGGDCADCYVTIHSGCGSPRSVPVRSVDVNGDGCVMPDDHDEGLGMCRDLNADGVVNDVDMIRHEAHCCDHCFPAGPGDWLGQHLALDPDAGFLEGDTITICWSVDNNDPTVTSSAEKTLGAYRIDSVQFFQAEQAVDPDWEWLTTRMHGVMLPTSTSLYDSVEHIAPSYRDMCLQARLYSDCCDTALLEKICGSVGRQCPPAALAFEFYTARLNDADEYTLSWSDNTLLALGWDYYFKPDTIIPIISPEPISFTEIQTSAFSDPGTSGALTIWYRVGTTWDQFSYRVLQDYYVGDICGGANRAPDCEVNVVDVVCLVDYIFRSGPPPDPLEHADMNLDGTHNVLDVVTLVDYVFRGGDPPPDPRGGPRT